MKLLFGLLMLACLGFFAFMQWGGQLAGANKSQAQGDLYAEKIKLLEMPPPKPVLSAVPVPVPQEAAVSAPVPASSPMATLPASAPVPVAVHGAAPAAVHLQGGKVIPNKTCMEWGEFSGSDLAQASRALAEMKLGDSLAQRTVEYTSGFWVYFPPLKNKAAVNRKVEEIKAAGIAEYFVVQDFKKWHNAISLGVFKTEEAAKNFQASLRKLGLRGTKIGERKSRLQFTVFVFKRIDAGTAARLATMQKDFANSELKTVQCNN
jgi:hypothetical protein